MKTLTKLLLLGVFVSGYVAAGNPEKYCSKSARKIDIHLFGYTYDNDSQRKLALQGLTKIKRDFSKGTKVRIFSHSLNGMNVSFDACVPGCNDSSATDQFFNSDCSVQVAKRDLIEFEKKFASVVLRDITSKHDSYDIFQAIQSLSDVYKNTHDQNNVFAVISMIPKGVNPNHRSELTALYVKKSETITFPKSFPSVQLIGAASNEELIKFWNEVFRNKAKFNFQEF